MWWILLAGPLVPLTITGTNLLTWRRRPMEGASGTTMGTVSVLIPARNEASNIVEAVASALAAFRRDENLKEVLVYDDSSTDGTGQLVRAAFSEEVRVRVIAGKPLPKGWVGKPHACQRLLEEACGDILLFMDADVRLEPGAAHRFLGFLSPAHGAEVVSAVPRQIVGGFFERLVLPLLVLTYTSWLPLRLVEVGRRASTVAANGQLMMMRRRVAAELGGFEAVRAEIVDDVAFCRHAKTSGYKVLFADGFEVAHCRMYRSAGEVWRGFSKNLFDGLGASATTLIAVVAVYLLCFVAPYVALLAALLSPYEFGLLLAPAVFGVGVNLLLRILLARRFRQPWEGVVLHPLSVLALCVIAFNSLRRSIVGKNEWAGRTYSSRRQRLHLQSHPTRETVGADNA